MTGIFRTLTVRLSEAQYHALGAAVDQYRQDLQNSDRVQEIAVLDRAWEKLADGWKSRARR